MATRPTIEISFKQLATTLIQRSERGTAVLFLKDVDAVPGTTFIYKDISQVNTEEVDGCFYDETESRSETLEFVKRAFWAAPYEVVVIFSTSHGDIDKFAKTLLKVRTNGWICLPGSGETGTAQANLASWCKSMEDKGYSFKVVGNVQGTDCKHYVYFNQSGIDSDGNEISTSRMFPLLCGILASCNCMSSVTNYNISCLSHVSDIDNIDSAIAAGQLVMDSSDGGIRIVTGINSLVTLNGNTATEDMQYIETVEAMDLIKDDIRTVFKNTYQGKFKNKYKNQLLFIGAVGEYFNQLAAEDILDQEFDNEAEIDVEKQRSSWVGTGKSEALDWDDDKVRRMTFKRSVFLAGNIKILNCMENLKFDVTLE